MASKSNSVGTGDRPYLFLKLHPAPVELSGGGKRLERMRASSRDLRDQPAGRDRKVSKQKKEKQSSVQTR